MPTKLTKALSGTQSEGILEEFFRDGIALVPHVLNRQECKGLRQRIDELFKDSKIQGTRHLWPDFVLRDLLEFDRMFCDLFMKEPILSLVEAVLGPDCRFCGQSVIKNKPGVAISNWHIDDCNIIDFPLPDDVPRHDARIRMPVFWLSVQIPLTDIKSIEDGPTQVIRGSHYSGRLPNDQEHPEFEGRGPESIFCQAGDAYLFNHQMWHRGAPNLSKRTRYLLQLQYAQGGSRAVRFQGSPDSPQLDELLKDADERMLRVLGRSAPRYGL